MRGACGGHVLGYISVDLRVTLRSFQVNASLLRQLLVARLLPLGKPALGVGHRSRVLRVKVLRHLGLPFALHRDVDLGSTCHILHVNICRLFDFLVLRHRLFYHQLDGLSVIHLLILEVWLWQRLLHLVRRWEVHVGEQCQVTCLELRVSVDHEGLFEYSYGLILLSFLLQVLAKGHDDSRIYFGHLAVLDCTDQLLYLLNR